MDGYTTCMRCGSQRKLAFTCATCRQLDLLAKVSDQPATQNSVVYSSIDPSDLWTTILLVITVIGTAGLGYITWQVFSVFAR